MNLIAYFYALSSDHTSLISYGTMFQRLLVPGWSVLQCIDVCEDRCQYMDNVKPVPIPHVAYSIYNTGTVVLPLTPRTSADQATRSAIASAVAAGRVFHTAQVWRAQ